MRARVKTTASDIGRRRAVLYVRVKENNFGFCEKQADKMGVSVAAFVDHMIDTFRDVTSVSKPRHISRRDKTSIAA